MFSKILNKFFTINFLLFLCSFSYYFFNFNYIFLNANSILSSVSGDSIKNYYTYIFHIVNDKSFLGFTGLNYPFGENFIYTDCQPLLTFVLRLLPFTHNYLIGILHLLILFSFVITPCIYYKIFKLFNVGNSVSFLSSLAIVMLSPQLLRIGGHFGLSYGCFIPLLIYLLIKYSINATTQLKIIITCLNFLLFFIHPYLGLGLSLLTFFYTFLLAFTTKKNYIKKSISVFLMSIVPIVLFKIVVFITDKHTGRPNFPFGESVYISNMASVFVSYFNGPFENLMGLVVNVEKSEWEGFSYVGFFTSILIALTVLTSIVFIKHIKINKIVVLLLVCAIAFLLLSFGMHTIVLKKLNIEILALNQFRAVGRFAWFFYYIVPIVLIVTLDTLFKRVFAKYSSKIMIAIALLFFGFNFIESTYYNKLILGDLYKSKNIFRERFLNNDEKKLIVALNTLKPQAILPIPFYHIGSEIIDRDGLQSCYISMLLSYHCKLPIIASLLSRTSVTETIEETGLLNQYFNHNNILSKFNSKSIALIQASDPVFPDEEELMLHSKLINQYGNYRLYKLNTLDFNFSKNKIDSTYLHLSIYKNKIDTCFVTFIKTDTLKPYKTASIKHFEFIYKIEKGQYPSGDYVVSFHYHFKKIQFKYVNNNFIYAKDDGKTKTWDIYTGVRRGHVYDSIIVFEKTINIDSNNRYDLLLNGSEEETYYINNFLLRPKNVNVIMGSDLKNALINNHPYVLK